VESDLRRWLAVFEDGLALVVRGRDLQEAKSVAEQLAQAWPAVRELLSIHIQDGARFVRYWSRDDPVEAPVE